MEKLVLVALAALSLPTVVLGQDAVDRVAVGDSSLKTEVRPLTRAIYEQSAEWIFGLTRSNVLGVDGAGATEVRAARVDDDFNRILATTWTSEGKYSAEYFLADELPIFVYEAFEYFQEAAPKDAWRSFKGLAGWERRSYVDGGVVGYSEMTGVGATTPTGTELVAASGRLLALVNPSGASGRSELRQLQLSIAVESQIDSLFSDFDSPDTPGYAVGIIRDGRLVFSRGYGAANLDYGIPLSGTSVFNVASLSKQFTAAALGILIVDGKVRLDDPVIDHIPEFPDRFGAVRVEHLVYMTSGIPEYYRQQRPGGRSWGGDYFTVEDAIAASLAQPSLDFEPGSAWAYSNINYMLISEIVARVSGISFAAFARQEIFAPLGMSSTHFNDDVSVVVPNRVVGYNYRDGGGFHRHPRTSPHYGGSGLLTTVEDLARWDRTFEDHSLRGQELTQLLLSTRHFDHDKVNDAFGLVWGEYNGRRTLWYEGGDTGFSSFMVRLPDESLTVIVLSNIGTGRAAHRARAVLDLIFG